MTRADYYWAMAADALDRSQRESTRRFYVAVAQVYRSLADGEERMSAWFARLGEPRFPIETR